VRTDSIIKVIPGERFTPCGLAGKFHARVMLESSSLMKGRERYSILLLDEAFCVVQQGDEVFMLKDGEHLPIPYEGKDILDILPRFASQNPSLRQDLPSPTGGFGYLSYEFARYCDTIYFRDKEDPLGLYDAQFIFGHIHIIFDHATDLIYILGVNYHESVIDLEQAVSQVIERMNDLDFNYLSKAPSPVTSHIITDPEGDAEFLEGVNTVREGIIRGDLLQGVLSRRLRIETDMSAFEAYKRLRTINPSPYMFYLDFGDYQLFGSSPEVMVKVKGDTVILRPIAGTRRRGSTPGQDLALEKELLADEKECAEHLMLIDLARNDLGRVCSTGSIKVTEFMGIERYSHVMHIVSEVEGRIEPGFRGSDVIRACFPAGTVTGAPKIRAIETIDALERDRRMFYAGLVGYMEADGNLDTCITIRTALKKDGVMVLQAGAGIVYDSDPMRELEETNEKLRAMTAALGVEV
jgi:anthranilate synthase component 1